VELSGLSHTAVTLLPKESTLHNEQGSGEAGEEVRNTVILTAAVWNWNLTPWLLVVGHWNIWV